MRRNLGIQKKENTEYKRSKSLNILLLLLISVVISCAPDVKPAEKKAIPSKKVTATAKPVKKKSTTSKRTASSSDLINHRDVDIYLLADLIHKEINKVKKANGLPLLKKDKVLGNAATDQNNYQVRIGDISHTQKTSKKENVGDRVNFYGGGFQAMSENVMYEGFIIRTSGNKKEIIAPTYAVHAKKMVTSWMNSPSHRKNIMNPKYDRVGTAAAYHGELHSVFATQVFGKKF